MAAGRCPTASSRSLAVARARFDSRAGPLRAVARLTARRGRSPCRRQPTPPNAAWSRTPAPIPKRAARHGFDEKLTTYDAVRIIIEASAGRALHAESGSRRRGPGRTAADTWPRIQQSRSGEVRTRCVDRVPRRSTATGASTLWAPRETKRARPLNPKLLAVAPLRSPTAVRSPRRGEEPRSPFGPRVSAPPRTTRSAATGECKPRPRFVSARADVEGDAPRPADHLQVRWTGRQRSLRQMSR